MAENCKKCKTGRLTFYDGAFEHNPRWVCDNCNAYWEDDEFMGYLDEEGCNCEHEIEGECVLPKDKYCERRDS
jgi:hypothetical protein